MTLALLADIGGTNSRFALCDAGALAPREVRRYANREFGAFAEVVAHYLREVDASPTKACLAVAGPMKGDEVRLTNVDFAFSKTGIARAFGWERLLCVNDFTALAMAVPHLPGEYVRKLFGGEPVEGKPISVVGPGTGLGVGGLLWGKHGWVPLQGEGGHAGFAPGNLLEVEILREALTHQPRVDAEHFISGSGLPFLHRCLLSVNGRKDEVLKPEEITWRAASGEHPDAAQTIEIFCGLLGAFAGDQALSLGALGGVYIGGGIVPQLAGKFETSPFRERFLAKGSFRPFVEEIPVSLLLAYTETALLGCASILANN